VIVPSGLANLIGLTVFASACLVVVLWKLKTGDRRRFATPFLAKWRRSMNGSPTDVQVAIAALYADLDDIRSDAKRACECAAERNDPSVIEACERTIWAVDTLFRSVTDRSQREVTIDYTESGERQVYRVLPIEIVFSSNKSHVEQQWFLQAVDKKGKALRSFAIKDIHAWRPDRTGDRRIENEERL
jgi:predicted DNA-binding transcriptional regulator YafY